MYVIVSRVDEAVFEGETFSLTLPGSEGVLTILPEHEPFITTLSEGTIQIETDDDTKKIPVENGLLEVSDNQASVLI